MIRRPLPDLSIVLWFLREGHGWSESKLGDAAQVGESRIFDYEAGRKRLLRSRLESLISFMGLPPEAIDETLARLAANRALGGVAYGTTPVEKRRRGRIEVIAAQAGRSAADFARSLLATMEVEGERLEGRRSAEKLWERLKRRTPSERLALIEESTRFRTWAMIERIAAESIEMASFDVSDASGLAELAVRTAELLPGTALFRSRAEGYALAHLANVKRVSGQLREADKTIAKAKRLWDAGAQDDPGFLNGVWIVWIEATLRRAQERPKEAGRRIEEALRLDQGELRARLLYTKSRIVEVMGDLKQSTALLTEAASLVDLAREPRFAAALRLQFLVNLCHEGRAGEAALHLPRLRHDTERLGRPLDLLRVTWIEGRVAAGTGERDEAIRLFAAAREGFRRQVLPYDYALVSLELAVVLLQESQAKAARRIAAELVWVFEQEGVPENALAALEIFCKAAEQEAATADLARQVLFFLYRAQSNRRLTFTFGPEAGTGAS